MKTLRIAIVVDLENSFLWQKKVISKLNSSNHVDVSLITNFNDQYKKDKITNDRISILWKLFLKLDAKLFSSKKNALSQTTINKNFENIKCITINSKPNTSSLDSLNLDIILNLTNIKLPKYLISSSRYGVWFLTHCDLNKNNKRPYGIWEMLRKEPETVAVLRYLQDNTESPKTIDTTSTCTDGLSYTRNVNDIHWQASALIYTNIELLNNDEDLFIQKVNSNKQSNSSIVPPFCPPSNFKILKFSLTLYLKKLLQVINSQFYFDQWALIFYNNKNNSNPYIFKNYKKILPPKDRFWADPFLIQNNNKYYLFIEELIYSNKLGHLSVMEIDEDGNYTQPKKILVKDYHLSYPFVFEDNGDFYMIPETSGNNDIQLYKATNFPLIWELEKVIMKDIIAVDTTIHKEKDTYWMFTNLVKNEGGSKHVELFLFSSKELISGEWEAHPLNPIVSDIKTARPAGALFSRNKKLYRPSQNCSNHYGYGLNISEITELNPNNFKEKATSKILPNWDKNIHSTHTFNSVDQLFIGDIKIKRKRFL